jgi:DNA mismatch endonuclease, patch repair protein
MSRIKAKNTKPELAVRSFLHRRGFRFALHRRDLPGTPDIVLPQYRTVVFVHGCLWHGHIPCSKYLPPRTHREYWIPKIRENRRRDARQLRELRALGWRVFVVWECQIASGRLLEARLRPLLVRADARRSRIFTPCSILGAFIIARFALRSLARRIARTCRCRFRKVPRIQYCRSITLPFLDPLSELREP